MSTAELPRITVIIPTRERSDVLAKALKTVTAQNYDNLEIIVSDNESQDDTRDIVLGANDRRITYLRTGRRTSMTENWEFALSHVKQGWVTIIGDDDGLLPDSLRKVAGLIAATGAVAIKSVRCSYAWPSSTGTSFGRLRVPLERGYEIRESARWLRKLMNGSVRYLDLPMLYDGGYINVSVLEKTKQNTRRVYHSCSPDIYSAVAIASVVKDYVFSHEPLAISGVSSHSTGTSLWGNRNHDGSAAKVFRSEGNIPLHPDIPYASNGSYPVSEQALVYESYLQSKFLRAAQTPEIHYQQLRLILALSSERHRTVVREWGQIFAQAHGLDFERADAEANRLRHRRRIDALPGVLLDSINTHWIGSEQLPIPDVFEASIAAAAVLDARPSRLTRLGTAARRLVNARVAKWHRSRANHSSGAL